MTVNQTLPSNEDLIEFYVDISQQLNRYLSIIILTFGVIGNIFNSIVLSQRIFRRNPCAYLFLISSIIDFISLVFGVTTRILSGWNIDPTRTHDWICKLRAFIVFSSRTGAIWLIMLATLDRWLLSSRNFRYRQLSSIKNAQKGIVISFIVSILFYIHMFYCYQANIVNGPLACYGKDKICCFITDLTYALMTILTPLFFMILFGLLTISNVHQIRKRIEKNATVMMTITRPRTNVKRRKCTRKKTDLHLLRMLFVQILLLTIFCIPQAVHKFYLTFHLVSDDNNIEITSAQFLYNIEVLLAFVTSGMPFYIYTLSSGSVFRRTFADLLHKSIRTLAQMFVPN
ncbi:unnamed protein product [Adineta ricciae]|uniref:G-protein coupled receptors family 1 profile domain-containing protein n=1 Tax=Adineta ricciae TaxID=249248 RepID=A0A814GP49_ADIRI|nr:unnamed protein product [Adineta ricciae]CAF0998862.1 unnamed protein product [Adineta ricciae]